MILKTGKDWHTRCEHSIITDYFMDSWLYNSYSKLVGIVKPRVHEVISDDRVFTPGVPAIAMSMRIFYFLHFSCVCVFLCV